jgi:NTP pyrophosphatase (non-canonical NTP hydrolase)
MAESKVFHSLRAANIARQKEWDRGDVITPAFRGLELAGEVGEACNVIKKLERERLGIKGSRATVRELAYELGDVVICADLIAMMYGIDLAQAVPEKFNDTSLRQDLSTMLSTKAARLSDPQPGTVTISRAELQDAIATAMQDAWNEICADTGCHPLDIVRTKGRPISFSPSHWASHVAELLAWRFGFDPTSRKA